MKKFYKLGTRIYDSCRQAFPATVNFSEIFARLLFREFMISELLGSILIRE